MKNTLVVAVFVLAVGGIGLYTIMNRDEAMEKPNSIEKAEVMMKDEAAMPKDESVMAPADSDEKMMKKEGAYAPFSPEVLASSANSRRVLFFYANWCPTCKPVDVSFSKNMTQIPDDVTVIRVNYNDTETDQVEKDLAQKYGVTYQHTFVQIDAQGNEVTKWNGGDIDELLSNIQ